VHTYAIYSSKNTPEHNMEILCVSIMCQDLFDFGNDAEVNQLVFSLQTGRYASFGINSVSIGSSTV